MNNRFILENEFNLLLNRNRINMNKIVPIGCDHAGFELKQAVSAHLKSKGFEVKDFGTHNTNSIDYPDYGHPVAKMVEEN